MSRDEGVGLRRCEYLRTATWISCRVVFWERFFYYSCYNLLPFFLLSQARGSTSSSMAALALTKAALIGNRK